MHFYKIKKQIAKILDFHTFELECYLKYYRYKKRRGNLKVVVFSQGRSGSNLLGSLLVSTGYFEPNGELLNAKRRGEVKYPYHFISGLAKDSDNFLFRLKIYHLSRNRKKTIDTKKILERLQSDGWFIIFLERGNKINQVLSYEIAEHRRNYHKLDGRSETFSIRIDCEDFKKRILGRYEDQKQEALALSNIEHLHVSYERHLENPLMHQSTINRILDFLGLEHKKVSTAHHKINTLIQKI